MFSEERGFHSSSEDSQWLSCLASQGKFRTEKSLDGCLEERWVQSSCVRGRKGVWGKAECGKCFLISRDWSVIGSVGKNQCFKSVGNSVGNYRKSVEETQQWCDMREHAETENKLQLHSRLVAEAAWYTGKDLPGTTCNSSILRWQRTEQTSERSLWREIL